MHTYTPASGFRGFPYLWQTSSSPSNKDRLSCLSQTTEPTRKQKGVGSTLEVGACQWLGPESGRKPGLGPEKGLQGGGGKTGWTSPAFLGCWLLQPQWIWVREISLEEDPRAFPTLRKDTGGVASGWSRGHTQCWGEPGRPQRDGRIPVLQTTLEQKAGGLRVGQGGGAPESYSRPSAGPAGKLTAPKRSLWKLLRSEKCKARTQESF